MKALIVNDVHLGVLRSAGSTPITALQIQDFLQSSFHELIHQHLDKHLILNGDLLDKFEIQLSQLWQVVTTLQSWLEKSDPEARLFNICGNHDLSPKAERISSFELLCRILETQFPDKFQPVLMDGLTNLYENVWAIPHMPNQDLFDMELEKAMQIEGPASLLLHCNYSNSFAQADHSLNISRDQAVALNDREVNLIIAHEHQKRVLRKGRVYITGNQWASSIADCLGNEEKFAHVLDEDGVTVTPILTQDLKEDFIEVEWTNLEAVQDQKYVRVKGDVTQAQAAEAIDLIAKFRNRSKAFVIGNALKVEGVASMDSLEDVSFEQIKAFNVLKELLELLEPKERETVQEMLA